LGFNGEPVIGILSVPNDWISSDGTFQNYIAAEYVKFVEMAGARAFPINWEKI